MGFTDLRDYLAEAGTSPVGIDATVDFKGYEFEPPARPGRVLMDQVMARWGELGLPS